MFKFICLVTLFAAASAQNWGWPIAPPNPQPPTWNDPQVPTWPQPQPPIWNQPQPDTPNFDRPSNRPTYPINTQGRQGVRDPRCPARSNNGDFVFLFPHDQFCSQYSVCNHGLRFTFECPRGLRFDRFNLVCTQNGRC